jgi:hypothetical protein
MQTNQPEWKFVSNLGDVNFIEYGGYFVYTDLTGVYDAEAEYLMVPGEEPKPDDPCNKIYRFKLDRCTYINGVLSDNRFHKEHPAWFAKDISSIARCSSLSVKALIHMLTSDNILERASAYQMIGEYHGLENMDNYPLYLSVNELRKRYASIQ